MSVKLPTILFRSRRFGLDELPPAEREQLRVKAAARSAAARDLLGGTRRRDRPDLAMASSEAWPRMTVRMLLKSCATPPASWPMASIFCDWRNCSSSRRCCVTSRNRLNDSSGLPLYSTKESAISKIASRPSCSRQGRSTLRSTRCFWNFSRCCSSIVSAATASA